MSFAITGHRSRWKREGGKQHPCTGDVGIALLQFDPRETVGFLSVLKAPVVYEPLITSGVD